MNPIDTLIEELSEEVHHLYCEQYLKDNGKPYWTNGDYSKLDEQTKEYDRNIARWHLALIQEKDKELMERIEGLRRMESDYDDEDKRARRDVRPYNEALSDVVALITNKETNLLQ